MTESQTTEAPRRKFLTMEIVKAIAPVLAVRLMTRLDKKIEKLREAGSRAELEAALIKAKLRDKRETREMAETMFKQMMGQYVWLANMTGMPDMSDLFNGIETDGDDGEESGSNPPIPAKGQEWVSITNELVYTVDSVEHEEEGGAVIYLAHHGEDGSFRTQKLDLWELMGGYRYRKPTMN